MPIQPPAPERLTGGEPIVGTDSTVVDFWSWADSDFRDNVTRARLAEYLVAVALGAAEEPRVEWRDFDVLTPSGIKVEVKSSAYLQTWPQRRLSSIVFSGLTSRTWSPETYYEAERDLHADVYVFAVVRARTHADYDALNTASWDFWVLPRSEVEELRTRSVSLATVRARAGDAIAWGDLRAGVESAATQ